MQFDASGWSGDGTFTPILIDAIKVLEAIELLRLEDAPASRSEPGYAFISNEIFVKFRTHRRTETTRYFGVPWRTRADVKQLTLAGLAKHLAAIEGVGEPDYSDEGMLQYLRTERIVPPYQTKGYKVVEMVRVYEVGTPPRS